MKKRKNLENQQVTGAMYNFRLALIYIILQIFTPYSLSNKIDLDIYFFSETWSATHFYPIFGATKYIFVLTLFLILFLTLLFVFFLEVILLRFSLVRFQSPNGIIESASRSKLGHGGIPLDYRAGILFDYYLCVELNDLWFWLSLMKFPMDLFLN